MTRAKMAPDADDNAVARDFLDGASIASLSLVWHVGVPAIESALRRALVMRRDVRAPGPRARGAKP